MPGHGKRRETCRQHAARAIHETEHFLTEALRHPEQIIRIPVIRVGFGRFAPGLSEDFWFNALATEAA